jgi:hypothetical protein
MTRAVKIAVAAAIGLGVAAASLFYIGVGAPRGTPAVLAPRPVWSETKWPFLMDEWGEGTAFRCKAADCGAELDVYMRAKIGFCSSVTGITDDTELDRLSDFHLMGGRVTAVGDGREIQVAGMSGRIRAYETASAIRPQAYAFSVAFNNNDDALVGTVVFKNSQPAAVEPIIIQFLNGQTIQHWVKQTLGM